MSGELATPMSLLAAAEDLILRSDTLTPGVWPRASAFLARQALEMAFREVLLANAPGIEQSSARAQLLCIQLFLADKDVARKGVLAWIGLSGACHHHPYELPATAIELAGWFESVRAVISVVESELREST